MKRYSRVWAVDAEQQLANLWLDSENHNEIRAAADAFESAIGSHPSSIGQELRPGLRFARFGPLVFLYRISEPDRLVTVLWVKLAT